MTPMANARRSVAHKRAIPAGRGGLVDGLIPETRMARIDLVRLLPPRVTETFFVSRHREGEGVSVEFPTDAMHVGRHFNHNYVRT